MDLHTTHVQEHAHVRTHKHTHTQIGALLDQDRGSEERRIAICVVDDLLEHSPAGRTKYMPQVCTLMAAVVVCVRNHTHFHLCCG